MQPWANWADLLNTLRFKTPTDLDIIELRSSEQRKHIGDHYMIHCIGNLVNFQSVKEDQFNLIENFCWMPGYVGLHSIW